MKKNIFTYIVLAFILIGCGPSQRAIQEAREKTQAAETSETVVPSSTKTFTLSPTKVPSKPPTNTPTKSPTLTLTEEPTETVTPSPTQKSDEVNAPDLPFWEMQALNIPQTESGFSLVDSAGGVNTYSGKNEDLDVEIYLYESDDYFTGFSLRFQYSTSIDIREQMDFVFGMFKTYVDGTTILWMGDNWPTERGEENTKTVEGDNREVVVSIKYLDEGSLPKYDVSLLYEDSTAGVYLGSSVEPKPDAEEPKPAVEETISTTGSIRGIVLDKNGNPLGNIHDDETMIITLLCQEKTQGVDCLTEAFWDLDPLDLIEAICEPENNDADCILHIGKGASYIETDGSFQIDNIPPGNYGLIFIFKDPGMISVMAMRDVDEVEAGFTVNYDVHTKFLR